jgi:hypothetical protein
VAIRWGYALTFSLGALALTAWTRRWLGTKGSLLAALVYTYLPWHLSTVYVRGAYAEAWLWVLWPVGLWAVDRIAERRPSSTLVGIAVGLPVVAATFWTQPGLAALFIPLMVAYNVVHSHKRRGRILWLTGALVALLAILFIFGRHAPKATDSFYEGLLFPFQLLSAAWGTGLSFQLGLAAVGLSIVAIALWLGRRQEVPETDTRPDTGKTSLGMATPFQALAPALWFWLTTLALLLLLVLAFLPILWQATGLDRFLSQPWQLLALTGLPLAFLAGSVVCMDRRLADLPALAGMAALVILASYPYLAPVFTQVDPGPEPVALIQPVEADRAQIMLLDHRISPPTDITPTLSLTLTWQALAPLAQDYSAFVHVIAGDDTKIAQYDGQPCNGECPTSTWQPGEIVIDETELDLPADAPPGPYRLAMGLYLWQTGDRATVLGRDDGTVFIDVP